MEFPARLDFRPVGSVGQLWTRVCQRSHTRNSNNPALGAIETEPPFALPLRKSTAEDYIVRKQSREAGSAAKPQEPANVAVENDVRLGRLCCIAPRSRVATPANVSIESDSWSDYPLIELVQTDDTPD